MLSALRKSLFAPPYPYLPHAVFLFFALAFLCDPHSTIYTHRLNDPDDYMRLNEVAGWIEGQGWFDLSAPRLSPGYHTVIHWSRLVDLPIAFVAWPFVKYYGAHNAALLASFIVPPVLFVLLLILLPFLVTPFTGKNRANLASVFALFAPMVLFNFTPGRVDHHGWQILIAGFGLACLGRMEAKENGRLAMATAASFACGLWIGAEIMPWLCLFLACLALAAAWRGGHLLRNAGVFGISFPLATGIAMAIALPRTEFGSRALSWFSPAYLIFAACAGGALLALVLFGSLTKNRVLRMALALALGFAASMLFVYFVPDALVGPFANYDVFNSGIALENINEARPLWPAFWIDPHVSLTWGRALVVFIRAMILPLAALTTVILAFRSAKKRDRLAWGANGVFLGAAILLTLFWQVRIGYFMQLFAIPPLTYLLLAAWNACSKRLKGRPLFWAETGCFLLLGALPVILIPAMVVGTPLYPDLVWFPVPHAEASCDLDPVARFLNDRYQDKDITIMAGMNEGPQLLFSTPYKYIGGNFNVAGNPDVYGFFRAPDDDLAKRILHKWHATAVLTCRNVAPFMAGFDHPRFGSSVFLRPGKDGKLHVTGNLDHPALLERLVKGDTPGWLKPVAVPNSDYLLFEVRP